MPWCAGVEDGGRIHLVSDSVSSEPWRNVISLRHYFEGHVNTLLSKLKTIEGISIKVIEFWRYLVKHRYSLWTIDRFRNSRLSSSHEFHINIAEYILSYFRHRDSIEEKRPIIFEDSFLISSSPSSIQLSKLKYYHRNRKKERFSFVDSHHKWNDAMINLISRVRTRFLFYRNLRHSTNQLD